MARRPLLALVLALALVAHAGADDAPVEDVVATATRLLAPTDEDDEGRVYTRTTVLELAVQDQAALLPGLRLVLGTYVHEVPGPPGGDVHGRYTLHHIAIFEAGKPPRVQTIDAIEPLVRAALLASASRAVDARARLEVARSWMWLLELGEEKRGEWWGADQVEESALPAGGIRLRAPWVQGKSYSSTILFDLTFDAEGRLAALERTEVFH